MAKNKICIEDMLKCRRCNKPFRKIDAYTYTPDCNCYNRKFYISVGRKCEPLKGKIVKLYYGWEDSLEFTGFDYDDIKSAIEGLKKELEDEDIEMKKHSPDEVFNDGFEVAVYRCIELIDKWFEDVIE